MQTEDVSDQGRLHPVQDHVLIDPASEVDIDEPDRWNLSSAGRKLSGDFTTLSPNEYNEGTDH